MITSTSNPQIKQLMKLQKRSKERAESGYYIVEGIKMFREAPLNHIVKIYTTEAFLDENTQLIKEKGDVYELVSDKVFLEISDTNTPQGILVLLKQPYYELDDLMVKEPLLLILESIQDPGNLGTMLRTAEGAGVTGVIMDKATVDVFNPKVIRSTMGSIYRVPFMVVPSLAETVHELKHRGVKIYAAHLEGIDYTAQSYQRGTGFLIGNESKGLSNEITRVADALIKIPMCGAVESLNAGVAASLLMYEGRRQRI